MTGTTAAFATALAVLTGSALALADLGTDVARLSAAWKSHGSVHRLQPRMAERGAPTVVFVPGELAETTSGECSSIAILGPTSTHFTVRPIGGGSLSDNPEDWPQPSLAGLVQLTRCGGRRARLAVLLVEMRSPQAVIEVVGVEARAAVPAALEVLPHRDPGPIVPLGASDPRPAALPLKTRLGRARARLVREGAASIEERSLKSSPRGTGALRLNIEEGCHRFELLVAPGEEIDPAYDLTVVPELDASASLVGVEHGDGLDASVGVCAAEHSALGIGFVGAPASASVSVVSSRWALPEGLPEAWGSTARARVAAVLRRHHARISGFPVDQALGVQGPTLMPVQVEPGACYVGVLVAVRGAPHALALAAVSGNVAAQNHGGQGGEGTLVSFCARARTTALFEADSRGQGLFWLFALFQNGRIAVGEPAQ